MASREVTAVARHIGHEFGHATSAVRFAAAERWARHIPRQQEHRVHVDRWCVPLHDFADHSILNWGTSTWDEDPLATGHSARCTPHGGCIVSAQDHDQDSGNRKIKVQLLTLSFGPVLPTEPAHRNCQDLAARGQDVSSQVAHRNHEQSRQPKLPGRAQFVPVAACGVYCCDPTWATLTKLAEMIIAPAR